MDTLMTTPIQPPDPETVVLLNPRNIDVLEANKRIPDEAAYPLWIILVIAFTALMSFSRVPDLYAEKREHDAFLANSQITQGTIDKCYGSLFPWERQVQFSYPLNTGDSATAWASLRGTCEDYPSAMPVTVRYIASDSSSAELIAEPNRPDRWFYSALLTSIIWVVLVLLYFRRFLARLRYKRSSQVRQGRIVSMKPSPIPFYTQVRYEVPTDDGTLATGKQPVSRGTAKRLTIDSSLAVLYADPKTHFVL
jgi:hypothetical protein